MTTPGGYSISLALDTGSFLNWVVNAGVVALEDAVPAVTLLVGGCIVSPCRYRELCGVVVASGLSMNLVRDRSGFYEAITKRRGNGDEK
jgi:hypothetical protein